MQRAGGQRAVGQSTHLCLADQLEEGKACQSREQHGEQRANLMQGVPRDNGVDPSLQKRSENRHALVARAAPRRPERIPY